LATFLSREVGGVFVKCYAHPEKEAVGVCRECGKGICEACAVEVSGRLYCRACIGKVKVEERRVAKPERATVITVASILFFVFGALGIASSILLISLGTLLSSLPGTHPLWSMVRGWLSLSASILIIIGLVSLLTSVLDIVAGYWLWRSLKVGGVLGIISCALGIFLSMPFVALDVVSTSIGIIINIALIVLIAVGWNTLK